MAPEPESKSAEPRLPPAGRAGLTLLAGLLAASAGSALLGSVGPSLALPLDSLALYLVAFLLGAIVPAALVVGSWPSPRGRSTAFRLGGVGFSIACAAVAGWVLSFGVEGAGTGVWVTVGSLAIGVVLGLVQGLAPGVLTLFGPLGRGARAGLFALCLVATATLSRDTLMHAWQEYQPQELPDWSMALVAAYPYSTESAEDRMASVVVDREGHVGPVVRLGGERFNLHRRDALVIPSSEVRRVRWLEDDTGYAVTVRFSPELRDAYTERSRHRASQYDAVVVDGEPLITTFYGGGWDQLSLYSEDRERLGEVYERLTGEEAPPAR